MSKIFIPTSLIKSPGILLKDKKDPSEIKANNLDIQDLLGKFEAKIESPFISMTNIVSTESKEFNHNHRKKLITLMNFLSSNCLESLRSPGKLKSISDKMSSLFQRAKDILSIYGIELIVEDSKITQDIYNLLKVLIPEICFFPSDFFKKLQLNKLILCKKLFCEGCSHTGVSLSVKLLDSKCKVRQKLYKTIFDQLVITNSEIFKKWREAELKENGHLNNTLQKFEEDFMALMNNTNHAILKIRANRLRELLAKYYPEAMSEERFRRRNKEKKKMFRVKFDTEPNDCDF